MPSDLPQDEARRATTPHLFSPFHWRRVGREGARAKKPLAELTTRNAAVNAWIKEGYDGRK